MKIAVSNTGPLIHMTQVDQLELLLTSFDKVIIPRAVYNEAIGAGLQQGYADAIILEQSVKENKIIVEDVKGTPDFDVGRSGLHKGEIEVIQLALMKRSNVVLLDDSGARIFARTLGLKVKGTLGIVIDAAEEKRITKKYAIRILNQLNGIMYLSSDVYELALQQLS
jgi:predicted nucleic acid-binding protein